MEHHVHDRAARYFSWLLFLPFAGPAIGLPLALKLHDQHVPDDFIWIGIGLGALGLVASLLVFAASSATVNIDIADRKVVNTWWLLGIPLRRKQADLADFDRISLHRLYRGGYRATLLGRAREQELAVTVNLARARAAAEDAAKLTGLRLADQL
jgi:hypothetical protein